jgi:hypothetical protein
MKLVKKWYLNVVEKNNLLNSEPEITIDFSNDEYKDLLHVEWHGATATQPVFSDFVTLLMTELKKYGWFLARHGEAFNIYGPGYELYLSPNYGFQIKPPRFVYHTALASNLEKIQKKGLVPKEKISDDDHHWHYPARVFFRVKADSHYFKGYVVVTVDTQKLSNTKFYRDATDDNAVWTYTHIPAIAITDIKTLDKAPVRNYDFSKGLEAAI